MTRSLVVLVVNSKEVQSHILEVNSGNACVFGSVCSLYSTPLCTPSGLLCLGFMVLLEDLYVSVSVEVP